jgi:hypothetical protein
MARFWGVVRASYLSTIVIPQEAAAQGSDSRFMTEVRALNGARISAGLKIRVAVDV